MSLYEKGAGSLKTSLPVVYIMPEAKQRLDLYISCADGEISGLGTVSRLGNDFLITAVHLFEQECTGASTDLSSEDVSKFLLEAVKAGLDPATMKLWWHSHANMGAFWSGTDESTAGQFGNGWMLSLVGNKRGEYLVRLDLYEPIRLTLDGLRFEVRQPENPDLRAEVEAEVKAKVKTKVYAYVFGEKKGGHYSSPFRQPWPWEAGGE